MKLPIRTSLAALLPLAFCLSVTAHEMPDPTITHHAKDGTVRLYGAGGPHTAFQKAADVFQKQTGISVVITAGPEPTWSRKAQADADILWGTAEEDMTAMLETYKTFSSRDVTPIFIRPAIIAVQKGNPKNIQGFDDLLKDGMKLVVTEGAGVANTSGTGVWEDVAGRKGRLDDVRRFRKNIVAFGKGSGASYKAFSSMHADAWITWPNWPITHPAQADMVSLSDDRTIWRDVNVALAPDADPGAQKFVDFLTSEEGTRIMKTEGWVR